MTSGSSQGLFVIVAVVIFGIFVMISYVLFRDNLKTGLASIFGEALVVESPKTFKNQLSNEDFKQLIYLEEKELVWDSNLNGNIIPDEKASEHARWSQGYNKEVNQKEKGYHAHINTEIFGEPVMVFNNNNHLILPELKSRWLDFTHYWYNESEIMNRMKTDKTFEGKLSLYSDNIGGRITYQLMGLDENKNHYYFKNSNYRGHVKATKQNEWESFNFSLDITEDMREAHGLRLSFYGHEDLIGEFSLKYVKDLRFGTSK